MNDPKMFLDENDIRNLDKFQQSQYANFLSTIRDTGIVNSTHLEQFNDILYQQFYKEGKLTSASITGASKYSAILAANLNSIIDTITKLRNETINGKRGFDKYNFEKINEGLEVLKKFTDKKMNTDNLGRTNLEPVLARIEELENQITKDINFYQKYSNEKNSAISDYMAKKAAYDKLSFFGKVAAKINGKKKELVAAQQKNRYYNDLQPKFSNPGDIINPYQYNEYIEKQQEEQTEGMRR